MWLLLLHESFSLVSSAVSALASLVLPHLGEPINISIQHLALDSLLFRIVFNIFFQVFLLVLRQ